MRRRIARRLRRLAALLDPPATTLVELGEVIWSGGTTTTNGANITYSWKAY